MEITYSPQFISSLSKKHLLLDTNVFRDAVNNHSAFRDFFNELKTADVTLVTIDSVKYELLKGSANSRKYEEKEILIREIVDATLPFTSHTSELIYELIREYGIDGTALSITDLTLGANLKQYKNNIYLMSRDTTDFMQNIFDLAFIINASYKKGIFTYGVYQYIK